MYPFLITMLSALFAQPSSRVFAEEETYATYQNDWYGFSYQFPSDWMEGFYNVGDFGVTAENYRDQLMENANDLHASVSLINRTSSIATEAFYEIQKKNFSTHRGYSLQREGKTLIDGKIFYWVSFTAAADSSEYGMNSFKVYMHCAATQCFALALQYDQYVTAEEMITLDNIAKSIRIYDAYGDQRKRDWKTFYDHYMAGDLVTTQRMLDEGYSLNDMDESGATRLQLLMWGPNDAFLVYLLEHGVDVNQVDLSTGETAIFLVPYKNFNYFQLLIDHGADLTIENHKGQTVYKAMKDAYRLDDAKFLKSKGAK